MADESMVRNLAAQAEAIWPQEQRLFGRYQLAQDAHVLGIDIIDSHLNMAREKCLALGDRVRFENRSIFELGLPDAHFDLVVCRHVLQAIPHADRAIGEPQRRFRRVPGVRRVRGARL